MANPNPKGATASPATAATATPAAPAETKRQKFTRLGGIRMAKAIQAIRVIGNLAGSGYEYTPADVQKIQTALNGEVNTLIQKFSNGSNKSAAGSFQF